MKTTRRPILMAGVLSLTCCYFLAGNAALAQKPAPQKAAGETLTIELARQKPWTGDLDGMIERRVIRVLTVNSKTFYFLDKGVAARHRRRVVRLFEDELNKKLAADKKLKNKHLKVRVVFIPVRRDQLLPGLAAGKGDIAAANLTVTPERQKLVDFTAAALSNVSEVVVIGPGFADRRQPGRSRPARKSSCASRRATTRASWRSTRSSRPRRSRRSTLKEAPETLEDEDLLEMLNAGLVRARRRRQAHGGLLEADLSRSSPCTTTSRSAPAARSRGRFARTARSSRRCWTISPARHKVGTSTGNQLLTRYLKNVKYVKNAASEEERKKFMALIQYFQKYGDQYDVDWVLMGAQGYQESQLNQNAKSPVGAIGVMQVMPATGKDMKVGDITETEANIHAGIKYMRWMIDHYYGKEPMTPARQGAVRVRLLQCRRGPDFALRKEAAKRGLDPNVWFQNVEYVAAEKIGQETVTYVSNIYKYYIAYRLIHGEPGGHEGSGREDQERHQIELCPDARSTDSAPIKARYTHVPIHLLTCKESPRRSGGFPVKPLNASMRERSSTPWLHARH